MTDSEKKDFIEPVSTSTLLFWALKSVAETVVGWLGFKFLKICYEKITNSWKGKDGESIDQGVPEEESGENS